MLTTCYVTSRQVKGLLMAWHVDGMLMVCREVLTTHHLMSVACYQHTCGGVWRLFRGLRRSAAALGGPAAEAFVSGPQGLGVLPLLRVSVAVVATLAPRLG